MAARPRIFCWFCGITVTMSIAKIRRELHRLTLLELPLRLAAGAAALALVASALPWLSRRGFDDMGRVLQAPEVFSGFGALPAFGICSATLACAALWAVFRVAASRRLPFGLRPGAALLALGGQGVFVLVLGFLTFWGLRDFDATTQIRFGLFLALACHLVVLAVGVRLFVAECQSDTREAFGPGQGRQLSLSDS